MIVSAFDAGSAGRPAVERSIADEQGGLSLRLSPSLTVWACAADLRDIDLYEPLKGPMRAALWPAVRPLLEFRPRGDDRGLAARPAILGESIAGGYCHCGFGFDLSGGPATQYAHRSDGLAGTLRFDLDGGGTVHVAWHLATITRSGRPDRPIGTVQLVVPDRACPATRPGHFAMSIVSCCGRAASRPSFWTRAWSHIASSSARLPAHAAPGSFRGTRQSKGARDASRLPRAVLHRSPVKIPRG